MRARSALAITALLLALPATAAGGGGVVASANGGVHWTIPLPNAFGVEVVNQPLAFTARKYADGSVAGHFTYHQIVEGRVLQLRRGRDLLCHLRREPRQDRRRDQDEQRSDPAAGPLRLVPGVRPR